jgi:heme exporter protein D
VEDLIAAAVSITALAALFALAVLTTRPFLPAEIVRKSRREQCREQKHFARKHIADILG